MKADRIIKGAAIFTSNKAMPQATALAVKDGRFVYVGDEAGLSDYEGEVTDLSGKFIIPGIIDSHVHVSLGVGFEYTDFGVYVECTNKREAMDFMAGYIKENPGMERYRFELERDLLNGETIVKEELDEICKDSEILILESEAHSVWVNSPLLKKHGITDDTPDIVPGLSYYVRKDGHVTGNVYEAAGWRFLFDHLKNLTDEQIEAAVTRWIDDSINFGVSCVFDAGYPEHDEIHERVYRCLRDLDREAVEEAKRYRREFNTEHLKVHTLKIFMDGTLKIRTVALVTPYEGTEEVGATTFDKEGIAELLGLLNDADLDLHVHTVGERASRTILDGVEIARNELGDDFHVKVTCAHLEIQDDADLDRFAKLGVFADYTPWWHAGNMGGEPFHAWRELLGEKRALSMYRCKSLWDSGAIVTFSSDEVFFGDNWSPYLGMEVGMTRHISDNTKALEHSRTKGAYPPVSEQMSIEEMLLGYTINGAKQLGIEDKKGSIEVGKDADYLVFDNDLLNAEHDGFSNNKPAEVYFAGKKVNDSTL